MAVILVLHDLFTYSYVQLKLTGKFSVVRRMNKRSDARNTWLNALQYKLNKI